MEDSLFNLDNIENEVNSQNFKIKELQKEIDKFQSNKKKFPILPPKLKLFPEERKVSSLPRVASLQKGPPLMMDKYS